VHKTALFISKIPIVVGLQHFYREVPLMLSAL